MQRDCVRLDPQVAIAEAEAQMRATGARHALVVTAGRLAGVVSHRDLLESSAFRGEAGRPVAEVMRLDPWTASESTPLAEAARIMLRRRIGCLPVVRSRQDGSEALGLVAEADLLRAAYF